MSYSFGVKGPTKRQVKKLVSIELARVVAQQPEHSVDINYVNTVAHGFIDALDQPEGSNITVSANGSVGYTNLPDGTTNINGISMNLSVGYV